MEKTKETTQEKKLSLEEKRLIDIRKQINNDELLDEYTTIYTHMMLSYASTLKINFDNFK
tara:strand:- start:439 stop:618 length:180 start_codon:yes stop_codon:yes gene_type:complete